MEPEKPVNCPQCGAPGLELGYDFDWCNFCGYKADNEHHDSELDEQNGR